MPKSTQDNFADIEDVEYRDYKREAMKRSRAALQHRRQGNIGSVLLSIVLVLAAALVFAHHYGLIQGLRINP